MKKLVFFFLTISNTVFSQIPVTDAAANATLGMINTSVMQISMTEKQELMQLREILSQTKTTNKNTYKTYEQTKRSADFLDKIYQVTEETEKILQGETKLADTIKDNESKFLREVSNLCNEASQEARKLSAYNNTKYGESQSKLSQAEIFISEVGYLLSKAIECRKMAGIHDKKVPLTPYERFDLKLKADNFVHEASNKIIEFKKQIVSLDKITEQLNTQSKKSNETQKNSDYYKEYNIKQPVIGQGVNNN